MTRSVRPPASSPVRKVSFGPAGSPVAKNSGVITPPFSPLDLSPALWLDASDTATITHAANAVSQWNDKSGNANHAQASGSNQPTTNTRTMNGLNVIDFDGVNDMMIVVLNTAQNLSNGNNTTLVVYAYDTGSLWRPITGIDGSSRRFGFYSESAVGPGFIHALNGTQVNSGVALSTSPQINVGVRSGTANRIYTNGGTAATNASAISFVMTTLQVGNGSNSNGAIAEIISCPTALTLTQINQLGSYAAAKWGTTWTTAV